MIGDDGKFGNFMGTKHTPRKLMASTARGMCHIWCVLARIITAAPAPLRGYRDGGNETTVGVTYFMKILNFCSIFRYYLIINIKL